MVFIRAVFQAESKKIKRIEEDNVTEEYIPSKKSRHDHSSSSVSSFRQSKGKLANMVRRKETVPSQSSAQPTTEPHPSATPTLNSLNLLSAYDDDTSDSD